MNRIHILLRSIGFLVGAALLSMVGSALAQTGQDDLPPHVIDVWPYPGEEVPPGEAVIITFDQAMDAASVEAAWQIEQGAALRDSRRASLDALRTSGPLDEVGLIAWMQGVNAVRLVVGERLGTSGDPSDDERYRRALVLAQGEGPEAEAAEALLHLAAVADLLAGLVDDAVHALGDD